VDLEVAQDRSRTMNQFTKYKNKEGHFVYLDSGIQASIDRESFDRA
jgi:hypothetical protein